MKTKLLALITLCMMPAITFASPSLNRLVCTPAGKADSILFEYVGESDDAGTYQVIATMKIFNGGQVETSVTNAQVKYRLENYDNGAGGKLVLVAADLGRTGQVGIKLPNGKEGSIWSNIFSRSFNLPNATPVECTLISHITPKPAISGSN